MLKEQQLRLGLPILRNGRLLRFTLLMDANRLKARLSSIRGRAGEQIVGWEELTSGFLVLY